jgi:hypothetical protein
VALQWPKCTQCSAQHQQQAQQYVQGTYLRWVAPLCVFRRENSVLAVGVLASRSTTCNNFIADLLFLSEVSHSLLVAAPPCRPVTIFRVESREHQYGIYRVLRNYLHYPIKFSRDEPPAACLPSKPSFQQHH